MSLSVAYLALKINNSWMYMRLYLLEKNRTLDFSLQFYLYAIT